MGEAKRRGTFEERKAQRLAKQYGLTNAELEEAYLMNRKYDYIKMRMNSNSLGYPNLLRLLFNDMLKI